MATTNVVNTATQRYWGDGQPFKAEYGDPGEPVITTETMQYWGDGQPFLWPFQNVPSGSVGNPTQLLIINISM